MATLSSSVQAPIINLSTYHRLTSSIERTQTPQTVESVLNNALNGSLWEQHLVFVAMVDTWPRLAKALEEVARESGEAPFNVVPFAKRNKDASPRAVKHAEFVEDAVCCIRANPLRQELDWNGLHESLAQGYFYGHHVVETLWHRVDGIQVPRAFSYVPPEFYRYPSKFSEDDRLMLNLSGHFNGNLQDFPPYHFLVGIRKAHLGHAAIAAPLRSLVAYWIAANFGLKWFMEFAQNFGVPLRWGTYSTKDADTRNEVASMLASIGSNGWGAFPAGTDIQVVESSRSAG